MTALAEHDVPFLPLRAAKASDVLAKSLRIKNEKLFTNFAPDCE